MSRDVGNASVKSKTDAITLTSNFLLLISEVIIEVQNYIDEYPKEKPKDFKELANDTMVSSKNLRRVVFEGKPPLDARYSALFKFYPLLALKVTQLNEICSKRGFIGGRSSPLMMKAKSDLFAQLKQETHEGLRSDLN